MNNLSSRQKYLYLVAKLYELAAEFTDAELKTMREGLSSTEGRGIRTAISALMQLHALTSDRRSMAASDVEAYEVKRDEPQPSQSPNASVRNRALFIRSLPEILGDKKIFPSISHIAAVVPGGITPRPKEGRERYIGRIIDLATMFSDKETEIFQRRLAEKLDTSPNTFIGQWKKLIKEM